ncbi:MULTISPECIES: hypothetical protein [Streptomyces]|uniref:Uncharacterized protein n=1 Tax=Streptomyces venezuelae TaxID=54571 RepID=A0A5P2BHV9_STRVZ|nr:MULTISPECIES: hypothetical protein [Streptomyces]NEA04496.1 hypothetical protein [Streptomyces sp. SID10116]MYY85151.1 hypothetical protein [Streptomyces sp. SID335]MYZ15174.1 hypothetical protein [Streptomyces sp. SID337]NDZ84837.1 hypothetical protein [Streptomyces sp. SID10115]NEB45931.1 hypothetical protein [Streptomyces sp. SID339]
MEQEQQSKDGNSAAPEDDFLVEFDFDGNWLGLTLHEGTRAEARKVAADLVEQFDPLRLGVSKAVLQRELEEHALSVHESGPLLTAVAYTDSGVFLADMSVLAYGEDGVTRPSPKEYEGMLLKWSYAEVKGDPQITEVELPIGPAVRVQAVLVEKRRFGWGKKLSECVRYWVWPTGHEEILLVEARWLNFERTDELTDLVDRVMPSLRLVPVPAEPGPSAPESPGEL